MTARYVARLPPNITPSISIPPIILSYIAHYHEHNRLQVTTIIIKQPQLM
jgi:hypothetical protein